MTRLMKPLLIAAALASIAIPTLAAADPGGRDRADSRWEQQNDRRYDRDDDRNAYYDRYAPPPRAYAPPAFYAYEGARHDHGRRHWQRGQYMSPSYRAYVVNDYGRYRLRQPPRGFYWMRADDNYLLVAAATGVIFDVISRDW